MSIATTPLIIFVAVVGTMKLILVLLIAIPVLLQVFKPLVVLLVVVAIAMVISKKATTARACVEYRGVQQTGCIDNELDLSSGV